MGDFVYNKSFIAKSSLESFLDDLAMEIQDADIGLDEYCNQGGRLDEVEVSNLKLTRIHSNGIIEGTFDISFNETYHSGCRDIEWDDNYAGTMKFDFNPETHELKVTDEEIQKVLVEEETEEVEDSQTK